MTNKLKQIVEAALLAAGSPLTLDTLQELFLEDERPEKKALREAITELQSDYEDRGIEVAEVAGGYRINVREAFAPWVSRLWEERAPRYSRALMETLALIAYRQPITRGEIEEIRGVSVSSNIVKTLLEREWVRVVGTRDVPGKPSLYATTREFLNYFGLKSLDELPTLQQIRDLDSINRELELDEPGSDSASAGETGQPDGVQEENTSEEPGQVADEAPLAEVVSIHGGQPEATQEEGPGSLDPDEPRSGAAESEMAGNEAEEEPDER
ncbi:MAG: SMC-Scp complex subunit ScpB [Sedimenticola sp.]|nr:SMC-Scp complex subunit ScpB [Sedimenticola sp.]